MYGTAQEKHCTYIHASNFVLKLLFHSQDGIAAVLLARLVNETAAIPYPKLAILILIASKIAHPRECNVALGQYHNVIHTTRTFDYSSALLF